MVQHSSSHHGPLPKYARHRRGMLCVLGCLLVGACSDEPCLPQKVYAEDDSFPAGGGATTKEMAERLAQEQALPITWGGEEHGLDFPPLPIQGDDELLMQVTLESDLTQTFYEGHSDNGEDHPPQPVKGNCYAHEPEAHVHVHVRTRSGILEGSFEAKLVVATELEQMLFFERTGLETPDALANYAAALGFDRHQVHLGLALYYDFRGRLSYARGFLVIDAENDPSRDVFFGACGDQPGLGWDADAGLQPDPLDCPPILASCMNPKASGLDSWGSFLACLNKPNCVTCPTSSPVDGDPQKAVFAAFDGPCRCTQLDMP
ncbi:MAG: hypothetical protein QM778_17315 [Myxococcales bacterium]